MDEAKEEKYVEGREEEKLHADSLFLFFVVVTFIKPSSQSRLGNYFTTPNRFLVPLGRLFLPLCP